MVSCAIHLFIDAFPSGWMKAIMDVEGQPKPAYFAYREALAPLMVHFRADRFMYSSGEAMELEAWICNDSDRVPRKARLHYQLEINGRVVFAQRVSARISPNKSEFQGRVSFLAPRVTERTPAVTRIGLLDAKGKVINDSSVDLNIFPVFAPVRNVRAYVLGSKGGTADKLAKELGLSTTFSGTIDENQVILIDDYSQFRKKERVVMTAVRNGKIAVFLNLSAGEYKIADDKITVTSCGMNAVHFVSRKTGHPLVEQFEPDDFKFWYDPAKGYITPLLAAPFTGENWTPILASGNGAWGKSWQPALAAAEKQYEKGYFRICQIDLAGRLCNPVARLFARGLIGGPA